MSLLPEPWRQSRPSSSQEQVFFFLSPSLCAFLSALNVCRLELQLRLIQDPAVAFSVVVSISGDDHSILIVWKFNKWRGRVGKKKKWHSTKVFEKQWLVPWVSLPDPPWSVPSVCEKSSRRLSFSLLITLGEKPCHQSVCTRLTCFQRGREPSKCSSCPHGRGSNVGKERCSLSLDLFRRTHT